MLGNNVKITPLPRHFQYEVTRKQSLYCIKCIVFTLMHCHRRMLRMLKSNALEYARIIQKIYIEHVACDMYASTMAAKACHRSVQSADLQTYNMDLKCACFRLLYGNWMYVAQNLKLCINTVVSTSVIERYETVRNCKKMAKILFTIQLVHLSYITRTYNFTILYVKLHMYSYIFTVPHRWP